MEARTRSWVATCAVAAVFAVHPVRAQNDVPVVSTSDPSVVVEPAEPTPLTGPQSVPQNRIASDFRPMLGNDAETVVSGLRNGSTITLHETTPGPLPGDPAEVTDVVIDSPTGPLGNGEVRHTLDLARFQLAQAGISEPTASQLQAALTGGSVTNADGVTTDFQGVLAMRSDGMGWGKIAQEMGTTLGAIKNGTAVAMPPAAPAPAPAEGGITTGTGDTTAASATRAEHGHGREIVTGTGETAVQGGAHGHARTDSGVTDALGATSSGHGHGHADTSVTNALGDSGAGHGRGSGIVDGLGASSGSQGHGSNQIVNAAGSSHGGGHGAGAGIVDGLGGSMGGGGHGGGASSVSSALGSSDTGFGGGHGGGNGGGHGHGN